MGERHLLDVQRTEYRNLWKSVLRIRGGEQKAIEEANTDLREIQPQTDTLWRNRKFSAQKILRMYHNDLVKSINPYDCLYHICMHALGPQREFWCNED